MASYYLRTRDAINDALPLFYKAIELDPDFASDDTMQMEPAVNLVPLCGVKVQELRSSSEGSS